jgi:hypothetical protein
MFVFFCIKWLDNRYQLNYNRVKNKEKSCLMMNSYAERINNRRIKCGISMRQLVTVMGWGTYDVGRKKYYRQISTATFLWEFNDLCKIINLFECSYDELFQGHPFKDEVVHVYRLNNEITKKIKIAAINKGMTLKMVYEVLGMTRQNYYLAMSNQKLRIYQINKLLETMGLKFHQLFANQSYLRNKVKW